MNRPMDVSDKIPTERLSTRADGTWELHKETLPPRLIHKAMTYALGRGCRTFHHGKVSFNVLYAAPLLGGFIFSQEAAIGRRRSLTRRQHAALAMRSYMDLAGVAHYPRFEDLLETVPFAPEMLKHKGLRQEMVSVVLEKRSADAASSPIAVQLEHFFNQWAQWDTRCVYDLPEETMDLFHRLYPRTRGFMAWIKGQLRSFRDETSGDAELQVPLEQLEKVSETEWRLKQPTDPLETVYRVLESAFRCRVSVKTVLYAEHAIDVPRALQARQDLFDNARQAAHKVWTFREKSAAVHARQAGKNLAELDRALGPDLRYAWAYLHQCHWQMFANPVLRSAFLAGFSELAPQEVMRDLLRALAILKL